MQLALTINILIFSGKFAVCFFLIHLLCCTCEMLSNKKCSVYLPDLCLKRSLFFFLRRKRTTKKLAQRHLIKATAFFAAVLSAFKRYCPGQDFLLPAAQMPANFLIGSWIIHVTKNPQNLGMDPNFWLQKVLPEIFQIFLVVLLFKRVHQ